MTAVIRVLLLAGLLGCPFNCMGALGDRQDRAAESPRCACCSHPTSDGESPPRKPAQSDDDCGCTMCLCHGAVLKQHDVAIDQDHAHPFQAGAAVREPSLVAATTPILSWFADRPPTWGRTMRILHQSFLF